jgi:hypothetical protein
MPGGTKDDEAYGELRPLARLIQTAIWCPGWWTKFQAIGNGGISEDHSAWKITPGIHFGLMARHLHLQTLNSYEPAPTQKAAALRLPGRRC